MRRWVGEQRYTVKGREASREFCFLHPSPIAAHRAVTNRWRGAAGPDVFEVSVFLGDVRGMPFGYSICILETALSTPVEDTK